MILFFLQFHVSRVEIYRLIRLVIRMIRVFRQREKRVLTNFVFVWWLNHHYLRTWTLYESQNTTILVIIYFHVYSRDDNHFASCRHNIYEKILICFLYVIIFLSIIENQLFPLLLQYLSLNITKVFTHLTFLLFHFSQCNKSFSI